MSADQITPETAGASHDPEEEFWREWYRLTPLERWHESLKLWDFYLHVGGSLDPE